MGWMIQHKKIEKLIHVMILNNLIDGHIENHSIKDLFRKLVAVFALSIITYFPHSHKTIDIRLQII